MRHTLFWFGWFGGVLMIWVIGARDWASAFQCFLLTVPPTAYGLWYVLKRKHP